jgi:hypothetical protein
LVAGWTRTRDKGLKGLSLFIICYLIILVLIEKSGYMRFLGGCHVVLGSSNYINFAYGLFRGLFFVLHSLLRIPSLIFLILSNSCALGKSMETNGWRRRAMVRWM